MIRQLEYKKHLIYYVDDIEKTYGERIIDGKYKVEGVLKDSKRNYVAVISFDNKKYILKEPRNEYRILQRKIMTLLKKGEALTTLTNLNHHIESGIVEYARPYIAILRREKGMIVYSSILMEYINEKSVGDFKGVEESRVYKERVVEVCKKIHSQGFFHGDVNVWNFNLHGNELKVLDTQGKKMGIGKYRAHYDMLNFKMENYAEMIYPYKKDIWYYLALLEKKLKKIKIIEWVKNQKRKKRNQVD